MWWAKDWVRIMQEELRGCLGVVFSVLVAVAREGPTTRRGRSIFSMALPGGSTREEPAHLVTGKPSAPNLENAREWHRRHWTNSHKRVESGKLTKELETLLVVCSVDLWWSSDGVEF
jgi:hypothetical protein